MARFIVPAMMVACVQGEAIKWTGIINDQQWGTANNWYPAKVPGANDDVTINDAEGKSATVVLVGGSVSVGSLTMGNGQGNTAHLRVLSPLSVSRFVSVGGQGNLEINSGDAVVSCNTVTVSGELSFLAGSLLGNATVTGVANLGGQAAKVLDGATLTVSSTGNVAAGGSIQFKSGSKVVARGGVQASGNNFQCIVMDSSTGNSFKAAGFEWTQ
eukprot:TRINITY_DN2463_c0_g1_i1.p2 TRINITY_DN2463_c0_g1~~TRINITY_DN2463_c0_g1_i1.p2  ORF type:complete len:234 (+),score=97.58 TRINITY_DN2463_c0_g1_i1:63-704(+)